MATKKKSAAPPVEAPPPVPVVCPVDGQPNLPGATCPVCGRVEPEVL